MQDILSAAATFLSGVAMIVGLVVLIKINAFDKLMNRRVEELYKRVDSQGGQKLAASEPIVLAVSELARFMQNNHDALSALIREDQAALEPRLQHMYAYMEQTLNGVSQVYQLLSATHESKDDAKTPSPEDLALLNILERVLQCIINMDERMRGMAEQQAAHAAMQAYPPVQPATPEYYQQFERIDGRLDGMTGSIAHLTATIERWDAQGAAQDTGAPSDSGGAIAAVNVRLDGIAGDIAGVAALLKAQGGQTLPQNAPLPSEALEAFNEELTHYTDVLTDSRRKLKRITRALDEANRRTETMQKRLNALQSRMPDGVGDDALI